MLASVLQVLSGQQKGLRYYRRLLLFHVLLLCRARHHRRHHGHHGAKDSQSRRLATSAVDDDHLTDCDICSNRRQQFCPRPTEPRGGSDQNAYRDVHLVYRLHHSHGHGADLGLSGARPKLHRSLLQPDLGVVGDNHAVQNHQLLNELLRLLPNGLEVPGHNQIHFLVRQKQGEHPKRKGIR